MGCKVWLLSEFESDVMMISIFFVDDDDDDDGDDYLEGLQGGALV